MPTLRVHIGHHFFGAGNLGDDFMLAGFLDAARPAWLRGVELTCCIPHDLASQRRRFPEVRWLPYDASTRAECIARADAWLGLGDTPFQVTGNHTWFLDHLREEAAWCRQHSRPMFYLGVGVNERAAAEHPQVRALVSQAERVWARDELSAELLAPLAVAGKVTAHADLAHLALAGAMFPPSQPGTLGLVLNFEDPAQYQLERLDELVRLAASRRNVRWLGQEVRPLPGSETFLYARLSVDARARASLGLPAYGHAESSRELLTPWQGVEALLVSRYHATLIGAWMGAAVTVFARNDKVAGAARQLELSPLETFANPGAVLEAIDGARPVARGVLLDLATRAHEACTSFFSMVRPLARAANSPDNDPPVPGDTAATTLATRPSRPPRRVLFLRPDAYGDLFLFEPVLRIVRKAWPEAEIAVLIRAPYTDVVPLFHDGAAHWLTTTCNPYRENPGANPAALAALRDTVRAFAPDCVVAACEEQTWLEPAVASFLPDARQVSLGPGLTNPLVRAALEAVLPVDWNAIYPERLAIETKDSDWDKNLRLTEALLGVSAPRWWPVAYPPEDARARAGQIVAGLGLAAGEFVACAAAGTANVQVKAWPVASYGETLAWLEAERGVRALLIGHDSERDRLEAVQAAARARGAAPVLWLGQDGEMPVVAGLLEAARFYFGNDTGALHLAGALGRPVLPIFGGGHWPRFRPVARRSVVVVQPLPCFGCGWHCYFGDAPCVQEIPPAAVRRAVEAMLASDEDAQIEITVTDAIAPSSLDLIRKTTEVHRAQTGLHGSEGGILQPDLSELFRQLAFSEADRAARLRAVEEQGHEIGRLHVEVDRLLQEAAAFWPQLDAARNERNLLAAQLGDLRGHHAQGEADRAARLEVIEQQGREAGELRAQLTLTKSELNDLHGHFQRSEADRAARLEVIEQQGREAGELRAQITAATGESADLRAQLAVVDGELADLHAQVVAANAQLAAVGGELTTLRGHHAQSEADRAARLKVIEDQEAHINWLQSRLDAHEAQQTQLAAEIDALGRERAWLNEGLDKTSAAHAALTAEHAVLRDRLATLDRHWTTRALKKLRLQPQPAANANDDRG